MAAASIEAGDPDPERPRERNAIPEQPLASGIRVLIVDDHALFRRGLREHLEASGVDVVGEAEDAEGAVAMATETSRR